MSFQANLAQMPSIDHLSGLNVCDAAGNVVHHIPAAEGTLGSLIIRFEKMESKLGSLKLYNALAAEFNGELNRYAAEQGLIWFDEHVLDAQKHAGKHPNIDLLFKVQDENLTYTLQPLAK